MLDCRPVATEGARSLTFATLTRFIAILLVALCAPAGMMRRVRGFDLPQMWRFAYGLSLTWKRGGRLRYPGEDLATVAARIDMHAWMAFDPVAALKHLARRARGHRRMRCTAVAPCSAPAREDNAPFRPCFMHANAPPACDTS